MFDLAACTDGDLTDAYVQLGALERAVHTQRLLILAELDLREAWRLDGATDTAAWVTAHDGLHRRSAIALVERARALRHLPALTDAAARGVLSADQLDEVLRIATPPTDASWAEDAAGLTAAQLRRLAAAEQRIPTAAAAEQARRRGLRWWTDEKTGMVRLSGRLTPADGALVAAALAAAAEHHGPDPDGCWEPFETRCADALVELVTATGDDASVATVVVHTTVDGLTPDGSDVPTFADGTPMPVDVARRLACDCRRQVVVESADGAIRLGRTARVANHHQRRRLRHRDPTCRFPGCERALRLHVHHRIHWIDGGVTDDDAMFHLCPYHHRFVHEHGWTVTGDPTTPDGLEFHRPEGVPYQPWPGPVAPEHLARVLR